MMLTKWQRLAANHRLKVFTQLPVGLRCDPTLFDIAMTHLIDNAVKYSPPGSPINVTADLVEDALVITVKDEGIGIPEEDLPTICDCLIRGQNVVNIASYPPGMGLGLDVVRRIVEAHGGDLTIKSILGRGTQVAVSLPVFVNSAFENPR
jgi:signal transduction histidine kinase